MVAHLVKEVEELTYVDVTGVDDILGCTRMSAHMALTDLQFSDKYELRYMAASSEDPNGGRKRLIKILTPSSVSMDELLENRDKIQKVRRP